MITHSKLLSSVVPALLLVATACASTPSIAPDAPLQQQVEPVADSATLPVGGAPFIGASQPLVSISVFVDPAEPDFEEKIEEVLKTASEREDDIRVVIHPSRNVSPSGFQAWKLLHYYAATGQTRAGLDFVVDWQSTWRGGDPIALAIANDAVDAESLRGHYESEGVDEAISIQKELGRRLGYDHGSVVVNGIPASGNLRSTIASQTAAAQILVADDVPRGELYETLIATSNDSAVPVGFVDSDTIPIGDSYTWGGSNAKVTIVAFLDLQCPFCVRGWSVLQDLRAEYGDEVRFVFKHFPLPFHKQADEAAHAAEAARQQGQFVPFVDGVFERYKRLSTDFDGVVNELVRDLQLDPDQFKRDLIEAQKRDRTKQDMELGRSLGVRGTPAFRINGRTLVGAQPKQKFEELIDAELAAVRTGLEAGRLDVTNSYARRVARNTGPNAEPESGPTARKKPAKIHWVPVRSDDHETGPADAPVTIVVFNDLQCPFCRRAHTTIQKLLKAYPKDVRFVVRHKPLPFHKEAKEMAWATIAADKQGKFWEMHDLLFTKQREIKGQPRKIIEEAATSLGLDMKAFWKVYDAQATHKRVEDDVTFAESIGIRGTPGFVINGRLVVGAKPYSDFEEIVKEEIAKAKKLEAAGTKPADLYKELYEVNRLNPPTH